MLMGDRMSFASEGGASWIWNLLLLGVPDASCGVLAAGIVMFVSSQ
jgi:hypothetical protein